MGSKIRAEQRQSILAIIVSLIACSGVSSENLIFGVSAVVGYLTLALSFYPMFVFGLHLTGLELERPATVRRWQALVVLTVAALSAWVLVFPHATSFVRTVAAYAPGCVLVVLLFGPWRGLMPVSTSTRERNVVKEEKKSDD